MDDTPPRARGARRGEELDPFGAWLWRSQPPAILYVEYTGRSGRRLARSFDDPHEARCFFIEMHCKGRDPKVVRVPV
jgi:hypothetical protein